MANTRRKGYIQWPNRTTSGRLWIAMLLIGVVALVLAFIWQNTLPMRSDSAAPVATSPASGQLRVNEVMASNKSALADERGRYPDWIELVNDGDAPLNVTGFTVSDQAERLLPFTFPKQTLAPGEIVLIYASGDLKNIEGYAYHAPFRLGASGDAVVIKDPSGALVDSVEIPALLSNQVYARDPETGAWQTTMYYTPGLPNTAEQHQAFAAERGSASGALVVSELMADNATYSAPDGVAYDYIELHNTGASPINLSGYALSDDENAPGKWSFPDVTIDAGAYLLVYASGLDRADGALHAGFKLSSTGETAVLSDASGRLIDRVAYAALGADRAYSRRDDGTFDDGLPPTPGYPNDASGVAAIEAALSAANTARVYLNEAMASGRKPQALKEVDDWLELYNAGAQRVDLTGYGLSDDPSQPRKWQFPSGASIEPGQYLVILLNGADRANAAKGAYQTNFKLSFTDGETLTLCTPEGAVIDRLPVFDQVSAVSYGRYPGQNGYFYMTEPTKGAANAGAYYAQKSGGARFSSQGGWFDSPFSLTISAAQGATIRYTLDATEPTETSTPYTGPIEISANTVVRARVFEPGKLPALTQTRTFLTGERHTLPVISLVTAPDNLYGEKTGIYTMGANKNLKYPYKGANFWKEWERSANVELFAVNGSVVLSQGAGLALQGQYSRMEDQKAFKITARNAYGASRFDAALFPNRDYTSYRSFILRASGQDYNKTRMRDVVLTSLADQTGVMYQDAAPVVVYLNGEYWGQYNMRERIHKYSIAQWENWKDVDKIDIVKANDTVMQGSNADYAAFLTWLRKNGCKSEANLARVREFVDVDNYLDYVAIEMYIGNTDLLNVKRYRSVEGDNKWRWILFDTDWAFYTDTDSYRRWLDKDGAGSGKKTDNTLFVQLMKNNEIKAQFLTRMGQLMHISWRSDLVLSRIDAYQALLEPEMPRQFKRWSGSTKTWTARIKDFRDYAKARPKKMFGYIKKELGYTNEQMRPYFGDIMSDLGI